MPRKFPKPFFRTARNAWYVQVGKQQVKLADGPQNSATEDAALQRYHEVMAELGSVRGRANEPAISATTLPVSANQAIDLSVAEVLDKYLDWCLQHRSERTFTWYKDRIQNFINYDKAIARLPALELRPFHVVEWSDANRTWSNTHRRGSILAVQRPFNWAAELGYIPHSPIRRIPKPPAERREQVVLPETWEKIKSHYAEDDPFREILEFCWETGCRPQEAKAIEVRHVQLAQHRVVFPPAEAKGKRRWRVIYLTPRAETILARLLERHPEGLLFRNQREQPWTAQAMACRFGRLKKHLGVKFVAYALRHGFATRKLTEGHDHLTVAELMGHRDGRMLATTYQHLDQHAAHLHQALNGAPSPPPNA